MTNTSGFNDQIPQRLRDRYQDALNKTLQTPFEHNNDSSSPTNPFIPNADARYWDADVKVMIFGKETRRWLIEKPFPTCKDAATIAEQYSLGMRPGLPKWGGSFHNGFKRIKNHLEEHYKPKGIKVGFAWNNVIKIGKEGKGTPSEEIIKWQNHWFDVTREEVAVYGPNLIVFLTGPSYDKFIKRIFSPVDFDSVKGYKEREMATLRSSTFSETKAVRTYHPFYLNREKGRMHRYLKDLINQLLAQRTNQ